MNELANQVIAILEKAKSDIQANMEANDINASGRTSASFRVERYDRGVRLVMGGPDTAPLPTLEVGRPAGPIPSNMTDILVQWSKDKGIFFPLTKTGKDTYRRSFAYLLGRRIEREGTLRHRTPVDVYTTVVLDASESVKADLVKSLTIYINNQLRNI